MLIKLVPRHHQYVSQKQRCTDNAQYVHLYHVTSKRNREWQVRVLEHRGTHFNAGRGLFTSRYGRRVSYSNKRQMEDNRLISQRRARSLIPSRHRERAPIKWHERAHLFYPIERNLVPVIGDENNNTFGPINVGQQLQREYWLYSSLKLVIKVDFFKVLYTKMSMYLTMIPTYCLLTPSTVSATLLQTRVGVTVDRSMRPSRIQPMTSPIL